MQNILITTKYMHCLCKVIDVAVKKKAAVLSYEMNTETNSKANQFKQNQENIS